VSWRYSWRKRSARHLPLRSSIGRCRAPRGSSIHRERTGTSLASGRCCRCTNSARLYPRGTVLRGRQQELVRAERSRLAQSGEPSWLPQPGCLTAMIKPRLRRSWGWGQIMRTLISLYFKGCLLRLGTARGAGPARVPLEASTAANVDVETTRRWGGPERLLGRSHFERVVTSHECIPSLLRRRCCNTSSPRWGHDVGHQVPVHGLGTGSRSSTPNRVVGALRFGPTLSGCRAHGTMTRPLTWRTHSSKRV
jgi:hypothetical protein